MSLHSYTLIYQEMNSFAKLMFFVTCGADSARAALNLGGTMLGFSQITVLPSKTAILPVNPTFLPRVCRSFSSLYMLLTRESYYLPNFVQRLVICCILYLFFYVLGFSQRMRERCVQGQSTVQISIRRFGTVVFYLYLGKSSFNLGW